MFDTARNTKNLPIYVDIAGHLLERSLLVENQPCWVSWKRLVTMRPSLETLSVQVTYGTFWFCKFVHFVAAMFCC